MKCNRCNLAIDSANDAFVTMPNPESCGYRSRRPTAFAHARCFEKDIRSDALRQFNEQHEEISRHLDAVAPCAAAPAAAEPKGGQ